MSGYIRQDVTNNIADGNVINASDFDNEYNAIEAAFHASTGHTHDGTAAEGAPITKIGPTQDVVASASALTPKTDNTVDLGSSTLEYKDLWIDGTANIDSLVADTADINAGTIDGVTIGGAVRGAGSFTTLNANGNSTLGDAVGDTVTINGTATFVNANPTLSAGTANGVLYLDGSKVATSGGALTFDGASLTVGASAGAGQHILRTYTNAPGFAAIYNGGVTPGGSNYSFITTATQTTLNATTFVSTELGGSEQMRLTSTGLGIGTTSPSTKLEVSGSAAVARVSGTAGTVPQLSLSSAGVVNWTLRANNDGGSDFTIYQDATQRLKIDSSGNLGIGTSSPAYKLQVAGTGGSATIGLLETGVRSWGIRAGAAATNTFDIADFTAGEVRLAIDSSGNVGVGLISPSYQLQVQGLGQETANLTDAGNKGGSLYLRANGVGVGSGGAVLFGTTFGNSTPFAAIKGFITDGSTNTVGDLAFSTRNAVAATALTERMRLTGEGNLGVGTTTPYTVSTQGRNVTIYNNTSTATVADNASLFIQSDNRNAVLGLSGNSTSTNAVNFITGGAVYSAVAGDAANSALFFRTGGVTERMRLDSSGNLGLGVTPSASNIKTLEINNAGNTVSSSGQSQLLLSANAYYNSGWKYGGTGSPVSQIELANGAFIFNNAPSGTAGNAISFTQAMTLDASGNLLVGGTAPFLSSAGRGNISINGASSSILAMGVGAVSATYLYCSSNDADLWNPLNGFIRFGTNNTERARITSGGYFKASNNGTYASSAGSLHELKGNPDDNVLRVENYQATLTGAIAGVRISYSAATPNTTTRSFIYCDDSTTLRAEIRSNGGLANYQSNNVDLSDSRTKKDIAPAASMWSKIGALEIVTYKYNDQTHDDVNVGVIAQQVEQVEPVWVDSDGFGETPEDGVPLKTVYTKDITFAAIKALQEAMTRIEQLEARVAALEAA